MDAAVDARLDQLDETFVPLLGAKVEAATANALDGNSAADPQLPQLQEAFNVLQTRSQQRFERARDQLQSLLESEEINVLDARLSAMVRKKEVDAGLLYVLMRNMEDSRRDGDEEKERMMVHIYTRVQEELEKQADPALALLHKLTRMDQQSIRFNLLRHNLTPQTETALPGGGTLPISPAVPAMVEPMEFASAIEGAVTKVMMLPLDRAAIEATAEEIRTIAKEARVVVAEAYDSEMLDAFSDALTPVFAPIMASRSEA